MGKKAAAESDQGDGNGRRLSWPVLTWKMEVMTSGTWVGSRGWKRQDMGSLLDPAEGNPILLTP